MRLKKVYIVYHDPSHSSLGHVKKVLDAEKISYTICDRCAMDTLVFKNIDLIITLGGDGTFLRAAHFSGDTLILGYNTNPKEKEGFFPQATENNFQEIFRKVQKRHFQVQHLFRLQAHLNGKKLPELALNEFYVGPMRPYHLYNYAFQIGEKIEYQRSSGVLVGTPAGSYAWLLSAGGKIQEKASRKIQYVVREPYSGKLIKAYSMLKGLINEDEAITITSRTNQEGIIIADSVGQEHPLSKGDVVRITMGKPLPYLTF